jgi:hypothetical protein
MARYGEAILALIREAGDWIASSEIREQVGKSPEQLRLALRKLEASGDIVRTGTARPHPLQGRRGALKRCRTSSSRRHPGPTDPGRD